MLRRPAVFVALFLIAAASAFAQQSSQTPPQTPPPPDTRAARERHRIQEKEPPPPEGPWGSEDFGITWRTPVYRGVFADYQWYGGSSITLDLPRGIQGESDGVSETLLQELRWKDERFSTIGGRVLVDLDMIRLSATYFTGTFDASADFTVKDSVLGTTETETSIHGKAYGFRIGTYWPALRYRDLAWDLSVGPEVNVGWLHEEVTSIALTPPIPLVDAKDILTGSLGAEASARFYWGRYSLEAEAEYSFMTGGARGWTKTLTVGVGIHF